MEKIIGIDKQAGKVRNGILLPKLEYVAHVFELSNVLKVVYEQCIFLTFPADF